MTTETKRTSFGWEVPSNFGPRGIITAPERASAGNLVLRVGVENRGEPGWHQVAHVVLTPGEARELLAACQELLSEHD